MRKILFFTLFVFSYFHIFSNNVKVEDVSIVPQVGYSEVQFNLSWDNSWRSSTNYDAVWVFAKYKENGTTAWYHCYLSTSSSDYSITADNGVSGTFEPEAVSSGSDSAVGVFIYRTNDGTGSIDWDGVKLKWDFTKNGLSGSETVDIKVFAIEMVYIPEGDYYLGDGSSDGTFRQTGSNTPVQITTSAVVVKCENTSYDDSQLEGAGILVDGDGGIDKDGTSAVDNPNYPTGYTSFYCMKYEISQEQYAAFLNTLSSAQASERYYKPNSTLPYYRYGIDSANGEYGCDYDGDGVWNETNDGQCIACNYISWMDGCAYADWSGLRPMTELEYEKVCRGPNNSVANEYAWGTTNIYSTQYTLSNAGEEGEVPSNPGSGTGNANYMYTYPGSGGTDQGPMRVGCFATSSSDREESGASYYGVMEMSGNLYERCVTLGNETGRSYEGSCGDGELTSDGYGNNSDWPGYSSGKVSGATGSGFRGGDSDSYGDYLRISNRSYAANVYTRRHGTCGFRCVR